MCLPQSGLSIIGFVPVAFLYGGCPMGTFLRLHAVRNSSVSIIAFWIDIMKNLAIYLTVSASALLMPQGGWPSHVGSTSSPQPLHKPKSPNHNEREKEHRSARKESG